MTIEFEMEKIDDGIFRAKVFGGWIVKSSRDVYNAVSESMVFIPDPKHEWEMRHY